MRLTDIEDHEMELADRNAWSNNNSSTQTAMSEYNEDNEEFLYDENVPNNDEANNGIHVALFLFYTDVSC